MTADLRPIRPFIALSALGAFSALGALLATVAATLLLAVPAAAAGTADSADGADSAMQTRYAPFQTLLTRYLEEKDLPAGGLSSAFDYEAALAAADTRTLLDEQRRLLAGFDPAQLDTREEAVAFWVNAYNFFMLAHILENPQRGSVVDSVRDYGNLFNPYRVFRQDLFEIGGRNYSLDEMEKGILLGEDFAARGWKEARVHFAVNCASVGCPPLRENLYVPSSLDAVLDENTRRALKTERHLHLDGSTLRLTSLFDWYASDYIDEAGSVLDFIAAHADDDVRAKLQQHERIRFIDYDWDLNKPDNFPELRGSR